MAVIEQERQVVKAQARWVHSSARKARLVTDLIRGRSVPEARTILAFSNRAVAKDVEKVLRSAVANAETHPSLHWQGDDLVVVAAFAPAAASRASASAAVTSRSSSRRARRLPPLRPCPRWRRLSRSLWRSRRRSRSQRRSTRRKRR